jgi:tetratricopeptide (TPR) repeat protein
VALAKSAKVGELPGRALTRLAGGLRPAQAAELLRRAQRQYPADFWVNENLGKVLQEVTPPEREEAVRFLTAAVALRPESPGAHLNLGIALYRKGQLDEAIACFKKVIELEPKNSWAHNDLGVALADKGQVDEAIACYNKAIEFDPKNAAAHYNLGNALKRKGQVDEAIASWKKAIEFYPKHATAHLLRHLAGPRRLERGRDGRLPQGRLRAVVEYIEEHLDATPSLELLAAVATLALSTGARGRSRAVRGPHDYSRHQPSRTGPTGQRPLPPVGRQ